MGFLLADPYFLAFYRRRIHKLFHKRGELLFVNKDALLVLFLRSHLPTPCVFLFHQVYYLITCQNIFPLSESRWRRATAW